MYSKHVKGSFAFISMRRNFCIYHSTLDPLYIYNSKMNPQHPRSVLKENWLQKSFLSFINIFFICDRFEWFEQTLSEKNLGIRFGT